MPYTCPQLVVFSTFHFQWPLEILAGGVRYLEKAVFNADKEQLKLVFEALQERSRLLKNVPYLSNPLPIMTVGA